MSTVTRSDTLRGIGGDGLYGSWDRVEDAQAERLPTVASSARWSERHSSCASGAARVQRSLGIVPEAHAYSKGQGAQTRRVYARPIYAGSNPGVVLSEV